MDFEKDYTLMLCIARYASFQCWIFFYYPLALIILGYIKSNPLENI